MLCRRVITEPKRLITTTSIKTTILYCIYKTPKCCTILGTLVNLILGKISMWQGHVSKKTWMDVDNLSCRKHRWKNKIKMLETLVVFGHLSSAGVILYTLCVCEHCNNVCYRKKNHASNMELYANTLPHQLSQRAISNHPTQLHRVLAVTTHLCVWHPDSAALQP